MKNEIQCLDLVMRKVSKDPTPLVCPPRNDQPTPHVLSPEGGNLAPADLSLPNIQIDDDDGVWVPDVQSGPNQTGIVLDVGISPQEIPTSQNHPSKSLWWCTTACTTCNGWILRRRLNAVCYVGVRLLGLP